jgi:uncharacterized RDD family membrane protein YckC
MTIAPPSPERTVGRQGNYAGVVTRLVAFLLDILFIWALYTLAAAGISVFSQLLSGHTFNLDDHQLAGAIVLGVWGFVYFAYQWSLNGKTLGDAILGIQVVQASGAPVRPSQAVIRTLILPFSILFFYIGMIIIIVQRERRAVHDLIAGTAVVYEWDARAAHLRWLARSKAAAGHAGRRRTQEEKAPDPGRGSGSGES